MSSVAEIEQAIEKLPREQFTEFARWFDQQRNARWDRQIEEDAKSGALNFLIKDLEIGRKSDQCAGRN